MDNSSDDSSIIDESEDNDSIDETTEDASKTVKITKKTALPKTKGVSKSAKAGLTFPVSRFQRYLRKGNYADRIGTASAVYLTGVLEYLTAEIVELAGHAARDNEKVRIVPRHIMFAIQNDAELKELLNGTFISGGGVMPNINPLLLGRKKKKKAAEDDSVESVVDPSASSQTY